MGVAKNEASVEWGSVLGLFEASPTGLIWTVRRLLGDGNRTTVIGSPAGALNSETGYYLVGHKGKRYACHRVVWYLNSGAIPDGMIVDHKDGNPLNNSMANLELKTPMDNARNKKMQENNTSGVTGVYLNKKVYKGVEKPYWMASWVDEGLVQRTKCFGIEQYGDEEAKRLASEHRGLAIDNLRDKGFLYTDRHGRAVA